MTKRTLTGPKNYKVILDTAEVFLDDPGQGTPAIVKAPNGSTGTYWCVTGEGEIGDNGASVPAAVLKWLDSVEDEINDFLYPVAVN